MRRHREVAWTFKKYTVSAARNFVCTVCVYVCVHHRVTKNPIRSPSGRLLGSVMRITTNAGEPQSAGARAQEKSRTGGFHANQPEQGFRNVVGRLEMIKALNIVLVHDAESAK